MNPEIKQRWVEALRSGEFPQTRGALHRIADTMDDPKGYCCLGVLCSIAVQDNVIGVIRTANGKQFFGKDESSYSGAYLTGDVIAWADLDQQQATRLSGAQVEPYLSDEDKLDDELHAHDYYTLADLNDGGVSFKTIANLIEVYL